MARVADLYTRFRLLPLAVQLGAGVALLVVVLWAFGALEGAWSSARDWWFDREQVEAETERDALRVERDAAVERAKTAEARAAVLEEQAEALKQVAANAALSA